MEYIVKLSTPAGLPQITINAEAAVIEDNVLILRDAENGPVAQFNMQSVVGYWKKSVEATR